MKKTIPLILAGVCVGAAATLAASPTTRPLIAYIQHAQLLTNSAYWDDLTQSHGIELILTTPLAGIPAGTPIHFDGDLSQEMVDEWFAGGGYVGE